MAKKYKWKADTTYQSDTTFSYGVTPSTHTGWQSAEAGAQSGTWTYWYRDANVAVGGVYSDANSSRVAISLTESWTATISNSNYLTITINTVVNSIVRDDLVGSNLDSPGRNIDIYRTQGGATVLSLTDNQLASAHTIYSGPLTLDSYTFTLAPGESRQRSSLFLHNQTVGYQSYDEIWFGVLFLNDLPKDYRPGATLDTNTSIWKSHNRTNGACHVLPNTTGTNWQECRTVDGDSGGQGNPPLILHAANANSWYNQKLLGKDS